MFVFFYLIYKHFSGFMLSSHMFPTEALHIHLWGVQENSAAQWEAQWDGTSAEAAHDEHFFNFFRCTQWQNTLMTIHTYVGEVIVPHADFLVAFCLGLWTGGGGLSKI